MKRLQLYLALTFGLTWGILLVLQLTGRTSDQTALIIALTSCMFMPALSSVLTRMLTKEGFHDLLLRPRFRGHWGCYAAAWFYAPAVILAGMVVFFALFPSFFDPQMQALTAQIAQTGASAGDPRMLFLSILLPVVAIGPVVNIIPTLGEELGWRGYLLPQLDKAFGQKRAILYSGIIWGVWHAPMIALGHNYGFGYLGAPWTGILMMTLFCVCSGAFLSWLTLKTGSVIPAAMTHSAINAMAGLALYVSSPGANPLLGPTIVGAVGGLPLILIGLAILARRGDFQDRRIPAAAASGQSAEALRADKPGGDA